MLLSKACLSCDAGKGSLELMKADRRRYSSGILQECHQRNTIVTFAGARTACCSSFGSKPGVSRLELRSGTSGLPTGGHEPRMVVKAATPSYARRCHLQQRDFEDVALMRGNKRGTARVFRCSGSKWLAKAANPMSWSRLHDQWLTTFVLGATDKGATGAHLPMANPASLERAGTLQALWWGEIWHTGLRLAGITLGWRDEGGLE
ncbi:hypothetical protein B0T16DRAFT_31629 [Cercophora newfieldiana]|uniref:Uncharacterized protein n=1 Tax=Cercophora newfieldiana TaxID=92897 RepID=A0AA40CZG6_9PEZI|nr:hypothetical protein B0T16DRAFT_31629 [Cercophora newfieldiana]